jgi:hypothetical protein
MSECPSCHRPASKSGARCLYCGGPLPNAAALPTEEPSAANRWLLVLDLQGATPRALSKNLELSRFAADQLARRGGFHLVSIGEAGEARSAVLRLESDGLSALVVSEKDVREAARPFQAFRGSFHRGALQASGPEGALEIGKAEALLLVRGEVVRARQAPLDLKRIEGGPLEPGLRIHLHRLSDPRPLELDPGDFESAEPPLTGSTLLEINRGLAELFPSLKEDTGFRHELPALAPQAPPEAGVSALAHGLRGEGRGKNEPVILDNLTQFRFYSAWRGTVERRRANG